MPVNPLYEPLYITNQEIIELPIRILGKLLKIEESILNLIPPFPICP
jgi:hypothetical protein